MHEQRILVKQIQKNQIIIIQTNIPLHLESNINKI